MSTDTLTLVLATSAATAGFSLLVFIGFYLIKPPKVEQETKKLKRCPTCRRWMEAT